jgi:hypothetical protein
MHIPYYDSCTKPRPTSVVTSRAVPGRRIGRANGPDRAFLGHFTKKKTSNFSKINPQFRASLIKSSIKPLKLYQIQPAVQVALPLYSGLLFTQNGPSWAEFGPTLFSYFPLNLLPNSADFL